MPTSSQSLHQKRKALVQCALVRPKPACAWSSSRPGTDFTANDRRQRSSRSVESLSRYSLLFSSPPLVVQRACRVPTPIGSFLHMRAHTAHTRRRQSGGGRNRRVTPHPWPCRGRGVEVSSTTLTGALRCCQKGSGNVCRGGWKTGDRANFRAYTVRWHQSCIIFVTKDF